MRVTIDGFKTLERTGIPISAHLPGCFERFLDLAVTRNVTPGRNRVVEVWLEMFNALNTVVSDKRNTTMNSQSLRNPTVVNAQYNAQGELAPTRIRPGDAGFGAATSAFALRSMRAQVRFTF
jgi:hypothetical protein